MKHFITYHSVSFSSVSYSKRFSPVAHTRWANFKEQHAAAFLQPEPAMTQIGLGSAATRGAKECHLHLPPLAVGDSNPQEMLLFHTKIAKRGSGCSLLTCLCSTFTCTLTGRSPEVTEQLHPAAVPGCILWVAELYCIGQKILIG